MLNIIGLSTGIACVTLIGFWIKTELSFDQFHSMSDRIYRITETVQNESGLYSQATTPAPLAQALENEFSIIQSVVRIDNFDANIQLDNKKFNEYHLILTDASFFKVFDGFRLMQGNPETALKEPYSVILSESMAQKYFGSDDILGKSIRIYQFDPDGQGVEYKITGIIKDCPLYSHFNFDFLVSFKTAEIYKPDILSQTGWYINNYYTYVLLRKGSDANVLQSGLAGITTKYLTGHSQKPDVKYSFSVQPLLKIHLYSDLRNELQYNGRISHVIIFASVGLLILILACFNYINLSIAIASGRQKDVGIRKVIGAFKKQLIGQYLVESWLMATLSLLIAIFWIELSRNIFATLTGISIKGIYTVSTLFILIFLVSMLGLLSGLYPAFIVSSMKPLGILKSQRQVSHNTGLRKSLVFIQFLISMILLISILVVKHQMKFIQNKDLGYDKDNLMILDINGDWNVVSGFEPFYNDLNSSTIIEGIARSNTNIVGGLDRGVGKIRNSNGHKINLDIYNLRVDFDYQKVYKMKMAAGRFFSTDFPADSGQAFVVNTAFVKTLGYGKPADVIGTSLEFEGHQGMVIGVVENFNYNSLLYKVEPVCMYLLNKYFSRITVRYKGDLKPAVTEINNTWHKHFTESVLDMRLESDALDSQYKSETRFSKIFSAFSFLSLIIASLGLLSLVSYSLQSRTREIGIRKVLGATIPDLIKMFTFEFIWPIALALIIAVPIAGYLMDHWLQNFAYHVPLEAQLFILAGFIILIISALTIGYHTIKSSLVNPVDTLRIE